MALRRNSKFLRSHFFLTHPVCANRRISTSSPDSQPQPEQGAGLHKIEATVREVKNSMLKNPPLWVSKNCLLMLIAAMYVNM